MIKDEVLKAIKYFSNVVLSSSNKSWTWSIPNNKAVIAWIIPYNLQENVDIRSALTKLFVYILRHSFLQNNNMYIVSEETFIKIVFMKEIIIISFGLMRNYFSKCVTYGAPKFEYRVFTQIFSKVYPIFLFLHIPMSFAFVVSYIILTSFRKVQESLMDLISLFSRSMRILKKKWNISRFNSYKSAIKH